MSTAAGMRNAMAMPRFLSNMYRPAKIHSDVQFGLTKVEAGLCIEEKKYWWNTTDEWMKADDMIKVSKSLFVNLMDAREIKPHMNMDVMNMSEEILPENMLYSKSNAVPAAAAISFRPRPAAPSKNKNTRASSGIPNLNSSASPPVKNDDKAIRVSSMSFFPIFFILFIVLQKLPLRHDAFHAVHADKM